MANQTLVDKYLNRHLGSIAAAIFVAAIIGGYGLVHQNDTNNRLTLQKIESLTATVLDLRATIFRLQRRLEKASADRWTRQEHLHYDKKIEARFERIENRVYELENKED